MLVGVGLSNSRRVEQSNSRTIGTFCFLRGFSARSICRNITERSPNVDFRLVKKATSGVTGSVVDAHLHPFSHHIFPNYSRMSRSRPYYSATVPPLMVSQFIGSRSRFSTLERKSPSHTHTTL